jgi:hypothetical protein
MELTAQPPAKNNKKNEEKRKLSLNKQQQQQQLQQPPQRRYSQGMAPPMMFSSDPNNPSRRKISLFHNMKFSPIAEEQRKAAASLNPNAPVFTMQQRRLSRPSQPSGPPPTAFMVQPISAWMTRRISGQLDYATSGLTLPPNVIRQPRGPENGKGFQRWCRNRMEPVVVRKPSRAVPIVEPKSEEEIGQVVVVAQEEEAVVAPVVAVAPVVVDLEDDESSASSSEEDEGHFSDQDRLEPDFSFENERIR